MGMYDSGMTLGMSIGYRKTLWMMLGELAGVAMVAVTAVIGIAAVSISLVVSH